MTYVETVQRIEPARLEEPSAAIGDVVAELSAASAALVRLMNAYYSNLIEGHTTRPKDIESALAGNLDADRERRNLQLEARAHVRVQTAIDDLAAAGRLPEPASVD